MTTREQEIADAILRRVERLTAVQNFEMATQVLEGYERLTAAVRNRAEAHYWATLAAPIIVQPQPGWPEPHCPPNYPWYPWWQNRGTCGSGSIATTQTPSVSVG